MSTKEPSIKKPIKELAMVYTIMVNDPRFPIDRDHYELGWAIYQELLNRVGPENTITLYDISCESLKLLDLNFKPKIHKPYYEGWGFI